MKNIFYILSLAFSVNSLALECHSNKPINGWQRTYNVSQDTSQNEIIVEDTLYFHSEFVLDQKLILQEDIELKLDKNNKLSLLQGKTIKIVPSWDNYYLVHLANSSRLVRCSNEN